VPSRVARPLPRPRRVVRGIGAVSQPPCPPWPPPKPPPPWEGGPAGRGVIDVIPVPAGSISSIADPALRRRGYCAAMVSAVLAMRGLMHSKLFAAGAEPANAVTAGFQPLRPEPDGEGVVCYARLRHPAGTKRLKLPAEPPR
jgi:hypothetical protein